MGTDELRPDDPASSSPPADEAEEEGELPYAFAAEGYDEDPLAPVVPRAPLIGLGRHVLSLVLALVAVASALVLLDYGTRRWTGQVPDFLRSGETDARAISAIAVGSALLLLAGWVCRISPLGPLVAGLVLGIAPWIAVTFYPGPVSDVVVDLPQVYDAVGVASTQYYGIVTFAVIGALLVGAALGASWRDR